MVEELQYPTPPVEFKGMFKDDLNIIDLHNKMLKYFDWELNVKLPELIKIKQQLEQVPANEKPVDTKDRLAKLNIVINDISVINSNRKDEYIKSAEPIINQYQQYNKRKMFKSEKDSNRLDVIYQYIELIKKYVKVDIVREPDISFICINCGINLSDKVIDEFVPRCPNCNFGITLFNKAITGQTKISSNKNNYEDRNNFYRSLIKYQGKQDIKLPDDIFDKLDDYFGRYKLLTRSQAGNKPYDERGRKEGTTLQMMITALKNIGMSNHYDDARLICRLYWGWILPNISDIENQVMEDYDKFQNIYRSIKDKRKSSLNTQLLLYHLLRHNGHKCYPDDFKIVFTEDIRREQEMIIKQIFSMLNWK